MPYPKTSATTAIPTTDIVYCQGMRAKIHRQNIIRPINTAVERLDAITGSITTPEIRSVRRKYFFLSASVRIRANWSATTMIRLSLASSDGWKVMPARRTHRDAPLIVTTSGLPGIIVE